MFNLFNSIILFRKNVFSLLAYILRYDVIVPHPNINRGLSLVFRCNELSQQCCEISRFRPILAQLTHVGYTCTMGQAKVA